ncbi:MAG: winged helix-turn-helix domain-containing protein [Phormidesmis sp. CAN_BIN36]|nr:winged helix-turn-helix domain-containing protein [Phormidesmis sp. CAN_BIN36]
MEEQGQYLTPFQRWSLQKSLQTNLRSEYHRRIQIMLLADARQTQAQICQTLGCDSKTARYWTTVAQLGYAHQWDDCPLGRPKTVDQPYLDRLKTLVTHSPREFGYSFHCWTARWLSRHLAKEFGIETSDRHLNRLLKQMGLSTRQKPVSLGNVPEATHNASITIRDLPSNATS